VIGTSVTKLKFLVLGWDLFSVVDYEYIHRPLLVLKLEPELFAHRFENVGTRQRSITRT
jgi:hypothetical protein